MRRWLAPGQQLVDRHDAGHDPAAGGGACCRWPAARAVHVSCRRPAAPAPRSAAMSAAKRAAHRRWGRWGRRLPVRRHHQQAPLQAKADVLHHAGQRRWRRYRRDGAEQRAVRRSCSAATSEKTLPVATEIISWLASAERRCAGPRRAPGGTRLPSASAGADQVAGGGPAKERAVRVSRYRCRRHRPAAAPRRPARCCI